MTKFSNKSGAFEASVVVMLTLLGLREWFGERGPGGGAALDTMAEEGAANVQK